MKRIAICLLSVLLALTVMVPGLVTFADQEQEIDITVVPSSPQESEEETPPSSSATEDEISISPDDEEESSAASSIENSEPEASDDLEERERQEAVMAPVETGELFPLRTLSAGTGNGSYTSRYSDQLSAQGGEVYNAIEAALSQNQSDRVTYRFTQPLTLQLREPSQLSGWSDILSALSEESKRLYEGVTRLPLEAVLLDQAHRYWLNRDDVSMGPWGYQSDEQTITLTGIVFQTGERKLASEMISHFAVQGNSTYDKLSYIYDSLGTSSDLLPSGGTAGERYARAFQALCSREGIPSIVVSDNGNSAWNLLQMEDGNWYVVDASASTRTFLAGADALGAQYRADGAFAVPEVASSSYQPANASEPQPTTFSVVVNGRWVYGDTLQQSGVTISAAEGSAGVVEWNETEVALAGSGTQTARYRYLPEGSNAYMEGAVEVSLAPRPVSVLSVVLGEKVSDGSREGEIAEIALGGILPEDEDLVQADLTTATALYDDADAGNQKGYTVTVENLLGEKAPHYALTHRTTAFADGVILPNSAVVATTSISVLDKAYDGLPIQPEQIPGAVYSYEGTLRDGVPYGPTGDAPVEAGAYTLTAAWNQDGAPIHAQTQFVIHPKAATVQVQNTSVPLGGKPVFVFTYTGLVGGEEAGPGMLITFPEAACADAQEPGVYPINITALPTARNYIFEAADTQGVLTVEARAADDSYFSVRPGTAREWYSDTITLAPVGKDGFDTLLVEGDSTPYTRENPLIIDADAGSGYLEMRFARSTDSLKTDFYIFRYKLDNTPPEITDIQYTQEPDGMGGVLAVTAKDDLSGIQAFQVITPENTVLTQSARAGDTAEFALTQSGSYTVAVLDNAGNQATAIQRVSNHTLDRIDIVKVGETAPLTSIEIAPNVPVRLEAIGHSTTNPVLGQDYTFTWLSSNESIARVDSQGNVTLLRMGSATIYAYALGTYGSVEVIGRVENGINDTSGQLTIQIADNALPPMVDANDLRVVAKSLTFSEQLRVWQDNSMDSKLSGYPGAVSMDIRLVDANDTAEEPLQPSSSITVYTPYPPGTDSSYEFLVYHESSRGQIERLSYTRTTGGIQFVTNSLSPFVIGYRSVSQPVDPKPSNPDSGSSSDRDRSWSDWRLRNRRDSDDFWGTVGLQVSRAAAGDLIRVNLSGNSDTVPVSLLLRLKGKDVTLRFSWPDGRAVRVYGKDIGTLPASGYYGYSKLNEISSQKTTVSTPGTVATADVVEEVEEEPPIVATMVITAPSSTTSSQQAQTVYLPADSSQDETSAKENGEDDGEESSSSTSSSSKASTDVRDEDDMRVPMVVTTPRRDNTQTVSQAADNSDTQILQAAAPDVVIAAVICCIAFVVGLFLYLYKKYSY